VGGAVEQKKSNNYEGLISKTSAFGIGFLSAFDVSGRAIVRRSFLKDQRSGFEKADFKRILEAYLREKTGKSNGEEQATNKGLG
jgi:hypothetical protein